MVAEWLYVFNVRRVAIVITWEMLKKSVISVWYIGYIVHHTDGPAMLK